MLIVKRAAAYLFDIMILFIVLASLSFVIKNLLAFNSQNSFEVWIIAVINFSLPAWLYFLISDASKSGATLGKKILRLQVRTQDGSQVGLLQALARTAFKLLPWELAHIFGFALADQIHPTLQWIGLISSNLLLIAFLIVLFLNRGRQSIHDLIVKTHVKTNQKNALPEIT